MTVTVDDTATPDPYGISSPTLRSSFSVGTVPAYSFGASTGGQCHGSCPQPAVTVSYLGPGTDPAAGIDWVVSAQGPSQNKVEQCDVSTHQSVLPPSFPVTLDLPLYCDPSQLMVYVSFLYLGSTQTVDLGAPSPPVGTTTTTLPVSTTVPLPGTTTTAPGPTTTTCPPGNPGGHSGTTGTTAGCAPAGLHTATARLAALRTAGVGGDPLLRRAIGWGALAAVVGCASFVPARRRDRRRGKGRREGSG